MDSGSQRHYEVVLNLTIYCRIGGPLGKMFSYLTNFCPVVPVFGGYVHVQHTAQPQYFAQIPTH